MNNLVVLIAFISLSVSCSKVKEAEKTMETMKEQTTEMKENTSVMYQQVRSKEAEDTRNKLIKERNDKLIILTYK